MTMAANEFGLGAANAMCRFYKRLGLGENKSKLRFIITANTESGATVFWTGRGFSFSEDNVFVCDSIDFAALSGQMEQEKHPKWQINLRIYQKG
jgi:hypothetical protein